MSAATAPSAPMSVAANAQPLRAIHRAKRLSGGATMCPGENQPGSLNAPSSRSSQCFAFQRSQRRISHPRQCFDRGIVAEAAHRRAPLWLRVPASTTRLDWQRIRNSPASQCISSRLVRSTCDRSPVCWSTFCESAVRALAWKVWFRTGLKGLGRVVMNRMVGVLLAKTYSNKSEQLL